MASQFGLWLAFKSIIMWGWMCGWFYFTKVMISRAEDARQKVRSGLFICAIIMFISWYQASMLGKFRTGTSPEGDAEYVTESEPTERQRHDYGVQTFLEIFVPSLLGFASARRIPSDE
jgi:hypothetical protein